MKIEELKSKIETKSLDDSPLIMIYKKTGRIICEQYINEIAETKNLHKTYQTTLDDFGIVDLLQFDDISLHILFIDEFKSGELKSNYIVCCHKISKDMKEKFKNIVVEIPEVERWQLKNYAKGVLDGLSEDRLNWFCDNCTDEVRFMTEVDRLSHFAASLQNDLFDQMVDDGFFDDFVCTNIFTLSNAIQKKDLLGVNNSLKLLNVGEINAIGLNNLLYNNFKDIASIKLSPAATPQNLDLIPKKFNALKQYVNYFTKEQLIGVLQLLNSTDYKIKSGEISTTILLDYIITHILGG